MVVKICFLFYFIFILENCLGEPKTNNRVGKIKLKNMKKLLFLMVSFCLLTNLSFASFPVSKDVASNEIVLESSSNKEKVWTKMTVKPEKKDFHIGGLLLGFLLGLIGVGIAYVFSKNPALRRSSWYGLGIWLVVLFTTGDL